MCIYEHDKYQTDKQLFGAHFMTGTTCTKSECGRTVDVNGFTVHESTEGGENISTYCRKTKIPRKDSGAVTSRVSRISPAGGGECPPSNRVSWARAQRNERASNKQSISLCGPCRRSLAAQLETTLGGILKPIHAMLSIACQGV